MGRRSASASSNATLDVGEQEHADAVAGLVVVLDVKRERGLPGGLGPTLAGEVGDREQVPPDLDVPVRSSAG